MLLDKLSNAELQMIDLYRIKYATPKKKPKEMASTKKVLSFWNEEKQDLYRLLGNKFMYEKFIKISLSRDTLMKEMSRLLNRHWFVEEVENYLRKQDSSILRYDFIKLLREDVLVDNKYNGEDARMEINGTLVQLHKGAKPLKVLSKIATALDIKDYFEDFRIKHSQILNQKEISGTLVLSIHPLDYMTMSDNSSGWSSCMSWREEGCYRRGTVEMMNSPCVLVAYLKSDNEMLYLGEDYYWNSKKWRTLCIFNRDYIASIKGYPYRNDELSSMVVKLLVNLAKENLNLDFSEEIFNYEPCESLIIGRDRYTFEFETNAMYNDFENNPDCFMALSKDLHSECNYLNYSGIENCMWCGETYDFYDYYESSAEPCEHLICGDCYGAERCSYCSGLTHGDLIEIDGEFLCKNCYIERAETCSDDNENHVSFTTVYLSPTTINCLNFFTYRIIYLHDTSAETLKRFTSLGKLHYTDFSASYILMHELTEEGLRAFGVDEKQRFIKYYKSASLRTGLSNEIESDKRDEIIAMAIAEKLAEEKGLK